MYVGSTRPSSNVHNYPVIHQSQENRDLTNFVFYFSPFSHRATLYCKDSNTMQEDVIENEKRKKNKNKYK